MAGVAHWQSIRHVLDALDGHMHLGELRGVIAVALLKDNSFITYSAAVGYVEALGLLEASKDTINAIARERGYKK